MTVPMLTAWTFDGYLKPWAEKAFDAKHGGYFTLLDETLTPLENDPKTSLTHGRLIYSYSHAAHLGAGPWAMEAAKRAYDFMVAHFWDEANGGWRMAVGRDGDPAGAEQASVKDAYDQAFAVFGFAWYYRVSGDKAALDWALKTIDFMDSVMADPECGGYHEKVFGDGDDYPLPRRQNPHMHLLEGLLALFEATQDRQWLDRARCIIDLMEKSFRDPDSGTLREFMGRDWSHFPAPRGLVREPGHHFEWTWLLLQYSRLSGDDSVKKTADFLYSFGCSHGIETDPEKPFGAFDEVQPDGAIIQDAKLLWPQTEALKAFLIRWEFFQDADARAKAEALLESLFKTWMIEKTGGWYNRVDRDGKPMETVMPTRLVYHAFLCLAETMRVLPEKA